MLEKDPSKRISAENALNHSYFTSEMDIEKDCKQILFKDMSNVSSPSHFSKAKDFDMTPTSKGQSRK